MSNNNQPTLLVTGASGHLGRRVLELLLEANAGTIIATTRTPEKLRSSPSAASSHAMLILRIPLHCPKRSRVLIAYCSLVPIQSILQEVG